MDSRNVLRKILTESAAGRFLSKQDATKIEVRIRNAIIQVDKERAERKREFSQVQWKRIEGEKAEVEKPNRQFNVNLSLRDPENPEYGPVDFAYHFLVMAEPFSAEDMKQVGVIVGDTGKPLDVSGFSPTDLKASDPGYWNSLGILVELNPGMSAAAVVRDWESYWDGILSFIELQTEYRLGKITQ